MPFLTVLSARLSRRSLGAAAAAALLIPAVVRAAAPLRVSVAEFPDGVSTPAIIEGLHLAGAKLPGTELLIVTAPMARSLAAVVDGNADLHLPLLRPPHPEAIPFDVTAARMWEVPFVIYTNKDKPLDAAALHEGTYKLETEVAHVGYFDFPVNGSAGFESSLRKVDAGRIDGFIFAANIIDPVVQTLGLSHIHRAFYRNFDAVGVVRKDAAGAAANRWFSAAIAAVQTDPAFLAVQHKIVGGYRGPDWQFVSK